MTRTQSDERTKGNVEQTEQAKKTPVWSRKVFTGSATIECAVFENVREDRNGDEFMTYAVLLKRTYKDGDDYKTSASFRAEDMPVVAQLAS